MTTEEESLLKLKKGMKDIIQKGEEIKRLPETPEKKEEIKKLERNYKR